ncbi:MAG: hypothetical protein KIH71_000060, partial [Roseobacter sp.]|nr:hypothetical protein [Roseobacter sp.]
RGPPPAHRSAAPSVTLSAPSRLPNQPPQAPPVACNHITSPIAATRITDLIITFSPVSRIKRKTRQLPSPRFKIIR